MASKKSGLTKRQKEIIKILADFTADNPITVQTISEKLKLSSRTILRELPRINEWFDENDFHLIKKPRVGMYVDEDQETRKFLQELVQMEQRKTAFTKEERQDRILSEIFTNQEPLKYFYFTSLFHISDGTLANDLDDLEQWMEHYNLSLIRKPGLGISWEGKEEDYRQAAAVLFQKQLKEKSLEFLFDEENSLPEGRYFRDLPPDTLENLTTIVNETQRVLNIEYTEHSRLHFILYLLLTIKRLRTGHPVSGKEKDLMSIMHLPECQVSNWIGSKIGQIVGFSISEGEIYCIAMQLLSEKIWKNKNESKYEEESFKIRQIVIKIVINMEQLLDTEFLEDTVLIDGLCNHMRPAINRIKMGVFSENGHLDMIRESYENVFEATKAACGFLKRELDVEEIPNGELGFIAMYFCAAVEKKTSESQKFSVCIACPYGIGTSHMLSVQIQKEFPEIRVRKVLSTAELDLEVLKQEGIELIISTSELDLDFPYLCVNSVLMGPDKIMIRNKLTEIRKNQAQNPEYSVKPSKPVRRISRNGIEYMVELGKEILQVLDNIKISSESCITSKKMLIQLAGQLFARNDDNAATITTDLMKREVISNTYIPGMNILFLHCETRGVQHCRFGFIALAEPVTEMEEVIEGAIVMLIPKARMSVYKEVMSEISGALAEKEQLLTALKRKDRRTVEIHLENSLGTYYETMMRKKGGRGA